MSTPNLAIDSRNPTPACARARASWVARVVSPAAVIVGCGALASRSALAAATPHPTAALLVLFCVLLAAGVLLPIPQSSWSPIPAIDARTKATVALVGIAAFAAGRLIVGGHAPVAFGAYAVATSTLAAIAEEAFFRRLCFGLLRPAGPTFAIVGSAALFGIVHVAAYGWWVLPLDLVAGLLLGWQREVSDSWAVPAVTHVIANLLVLV